MRYTTIIDIRELDAIYRNKNVRLVYLHMVLKSGYHDEDRDLLRCSIRNLAWEIGLSVSAVRHALHVLMKSGMVSKNGESWQVKKFFLDTPPTPRPKKAQAQAVKAEGNIGSRYEQEKQDYQQRVIAAVRQCSREEIEAWIEELANGRSIRHHGVAINANQNNIKWLTAVLDKMT